MKHSDTDAASPQLCRRAALQPRVSTTVCAAAEGVSALAMYVSPEDDICVISGWHPYVFSWWHAWLLLRASMPSFNVIQMFYWYYVAKSCEMKANIFRVLTISASWKIRRHFAAWNLIYGDTKKINIVAKKRGLKHVEKVRWALRTVWKTLSNLLHCLLTLPFFAKLRSKLWNQRSFGVVLAHIFISFKSGDYWLIATLVLDL